MLMRVAGMQSCRYGLDMDTYCIRVVVAAAAEEGRYRGPWDSYILGVAVVAAAVEVAASAESTPIADDTALGKCA